MANNPATISQVKKIGIVYYGPYPEDRGIDQVVSCMRTVGYEPEVIAKRNVQIKRTAPNEVPTYNVSRNGGGLQRLLWAPVPFNWNWQRIIKSFAVKHHWQAIWVRESPLAWAGLSVGRSLKIPVFLDIRENLRAMYASGRRTLVRRITRPSFPIYIYEKAHLPLFSHIFTVSEELGKWLEQEYGVNANNRSVLGNFPSKLFLRNARNAIKDLPDPQDNFFRLVFSGYIRKNRGLQDILEAMKIVNSRGFSDIRLKIIGDGDYKSTLMQLSKDLGVDDLIEWSPLIPPRELPKELAKCDVGLCPYLLSDQTNQTLPGKLFEFMAAGLPVLSSERKPVCRILETEKCGLTYHSRNPELIADKIIEMYEMNEKLLDMKNNSLNAIEHHYNESANYHVIRNVLEDFNL